MDKEIMFKNILMQKLSTNVTNIRTNITSTTPLPNSNVVNVDAISDFTKPGNDYKSAPFANTYSAPAYQNTQVNNTIEVPNVLKNEVKKPNLNVIRLLIGIMLVADIGVAILIYLVFYR